MAEIEITEVTRDDIGRFSLCGYKNKKRPGYLEKRNWVLARMEEGLRMLTVQSSRDGTQGMVEYMPGARCWRPVSADNYMVIHCVFVGFKSAYKGKGYASLLIKRCEEDARKEKLDGVAVVTREGPFMAGSEIFLEHGYTAADGAKPDFSLMVKSFRANAKAATFAPSVSAVPKAYAKGLFVIRADQCPYTVTNVREIVESAREDFSLTAKVVNLETFRQARESPCPFGTFGILYDGKVIAHHPISSGRFKNLMAKLRSV